ncbi:MarR family winged helix-turn-helix transcriptional regulator [Nocardioides sambongensis]|uniref:MarR family winged helix-turn-helix transcriptional regulator n=1 Tax=Nocardioides sambongensis TaxID=2589074 RepID=UPI001E2B467A|nr:MarR family transcriptional regulator [Nocardioides sambongensis]
MNASDPGRPDRLAGIELESMILGRHVTPSAHSEGFGLNLERSAYTLLTRIDIQGPMSIGELSEAFGLDASTLNRQTARMVRQGLLRRIPDPEGGVARKFEMTEDGAAQMRSDRRRRREGLDRVLEEWSDDDVATLAELLGRFNGAIESRDGRPWPRR